MHRMSVHARPPVSAGTHRYGSGRVTAATGDDTSALHSRCTASGRGWGPACARPSSQRVRNDQLLDLGRPFVDAQGPDLPVQALGDAVGNQAGRPVDLDGSIDDLLRGLGGRYLGDTRMLR